MKYFLLQTDISDAKDYLGYVKAFNEMSDKENAGIVLSWFVGISRANDAIQQGELIDKNDINNKISDVSNAVVNEIDASFIEQYCLGNTYASILALVNEKKNIMAKLQCVQKEFVKRLCCLSQMSLSYRQDMCSKKCKRLPRVDLL